MRKPLPRFGGCKYAPKVVSVTGLKNCYRVVQNDGSWRHSTILGPVKSTAVEAIEAWRIMWLANQPDGGKA